MALPPCDICGVYESLILQTNLQTGDTAGVCGNDLLPFMAQLAASIISEADDATQAAYAEALDTLRAADRRPAPPVPAPKPSRRSRAASGPPEAISAPLPASGGTWALSAIASSQPPPPVDPELAALAIDGPAPVATTDTPF